MEEHIANQEKGTADFDALMREKDFQSEFDRRVSRALETARGKWAQETKQQVERARIEAERLARMTSEERVAHDFAQRENELMLRERQLAQRELRSSVEAALRERQLPAELAAALHYESAEQIQDGIEALDNAFRNAVQNGVEMRMRGNIPQIARKASPSGEVSDDEYYRTHCH